MLRELGGLAETPLVHHETGYLHSKGSESVDYGRHQEHDDRN